VFSPEVHRSLSRVHPNLTVVVFFGTSGFGSFRTSPPDFLRSTFPQSCRSGATHPQNGWSIFTSGVSGFGSFNFPTPIFLRSSFSRSPQILVVCPPQIDGRRSLRSSNSTCRPPPSSEVPKYVAVISSDMWRSHQS
jgi:hypothetical protein